MGMASLLLAAIALCFFALVAQAEERRLADRFGGVQSISWGPCPGNDAYRSSFTSLKRCFKMKEVSRRSTGGFILGECPTYIEAVPAVTVKNCSAIGIELMSAFLCSLGVGFTDTAQLIENTSASLDANFCVDGTIGLQNLISTRIFVAQGGDAEVRGVCEPAQFIPCNETDARTFVGLTLAALTVNGSSNCARGLQVECSHCLPYIDTEAVAQPYYFIIIAGFKMVLVVCLRLFVFDHISTRVRRRMERFERERPAPIDELGEDFTKFLIRELLKDGQYRIRLLKTLRSRDGKKFFKQMLRAFQANSNSKFTKEDWEKFTGPKGVSLQHALFSRPVAVSNYLFVASQMLDESDTKLTPKVMNSLNNEEEWFWQEACQCGAKMYNGDLALLTDLFKDVWKIHQRPHYITNEKHDTSDLTDDRVMFFRAVGEENDVTAAEFIIYCELSTPFATLYECLEPLLIEDGRPHDVFTVYNTKGDLVVTTTETTVEDLLRESCFQRGDNPNYITMRFSTDPNLHPSSVGPCYYKPLFSFLDDRRKKFMETATFELPRFEPKKLLDMTHQDVTKIMDSRFQSSLSEKLLLMTGDEVVFDYDVENEFYFRDQASEVVRLKKADRDLGKHRSNEPFEDENKEKKMKDDPSHEPVEPEEKIPKHLSADEEGSDSLWCFECFFNIDQPEGENARKKKFKDHIPTGPPTCAVFKLDADSPLLKLESEVIVDPHEVQKLYNDVYSRIVSLTYYDGRPRRAILNCQKSNRKQLRQILNEMYDVCDSRIKTLRGDRLAVDVEGIVAQFRDQIESVGMIIPVVKKEEQVYMTVFSVNIIILAVDVAYSAGFLVVCLLRADIDIGMWASSWTLYELCFFRFLNSGTPIAVLGASIANLSTGAEARFHSMFLAIVDYGLFAISLLMMTSALFTHLFAGLSVFIWVFLGVTTLLLVPSIIIGKLYNVLHDKWTSVSRVEERMKNEQILKGLLTVVCLWFQFSVVIIMTAAFQTSFNWAHLFYRKGDLDLGYFDVLEYEWNARGSACYIERSLGNPANVMQLLGSFV